MNEVTRHICWHQNFVPWRLSVPANEHLLYKIRLQGDFWNLQHMTEVTRGSCWHQTFVPKGLSAPALGLYTCLNHEKKCIKSYRVFFKLVANDLSDKRFLLTSKFCPLGLSALICGCTHLLNHEKMCIKSEVEDILFKLATNDHSDEAFLLT